MVEGGARRARTAFVAVGLVVAGTRLATTHEVVAAVATGTLAAALVGAGIATNRRSHRAGWLRAWLLLWAALACRAAGTILEAVSPSSGDFPSTVHALQGAGALGALVGIGRLLRHRHPRRATEVLFDASVGTTLLAIGLWLLVVDPRPDPAASEGALLYAFAVVGIGVATLWVLVRLMWLTDEHPVAYRYLAVGLLCTTTVDAVIAGGLLQGGGFGDRYRSALVLWGYVLWAVAALHPSMRKAFEPVPLGPADLHPSRVAFVVGAALLGPALVAVQTLRGVPISVAAQLVASTAVPLLVTLEMVRQVRERATREYLAQHDALTGLPNRVLFHDRLETALAHARRSDRRVAVLFLDLDRFKEVNDSLGHDVGNQLLQGVARRLRSCLREQDAVARFGGDEFTILLTDLESADACTVVAEKVLRAFADPFPVTGRDLFAGTSVGVALFPDDGVDAETLMKNADTAMYRAKAKGRSGYELYTRDMSTRAEVRHSLEGSLHRAIHRGELTLHYQPKVRRGDRRLTGVEALVRWQHPRLGSIPPAAFVPLAEESGLILPLGEWVLREACEQAATWSRRRPEPIAVAVNVSARQFMHEPLEHVVGRVLDETGLDPALLELELTESVFLRDINAVNVTMQRLHEMGVRCAIDDFGTGFSALNYLGRMPIDTVKIDGSFVRAIRPDSPAPLLVAMIAMAKSLDLGVVAEGVETEEQAEFLLRHGCEQMQGYLFSRPLPAIELEQLEMLGGAPARADVRALVGGAPAARGPRGLDPDLVIDLLRGACTDGDPIQVDRDLVDAVLAALDDPQLALAHVGPRSLSVRMAAGTIAGLVPLTGGLLAADVLPAGAQRYANLAFSNLGVEVPHHHAEPAPPAALEALGVPGPAPAEARRAPRRDRARTLPEVAITEIAAGAGAAPPAAGDLAAPPVAPVEPTSDEPVAHRAPAPPIHREPATPRVSRPPRIPVLPPPAPTVVPPPPPLPPPAAPATPAAPAAPPADPDPEPGRPDVPPTRPRPGPDRPDVAPPDPAPVPPAAEPGPPGPPPGREPAPAGPPTDPGRPDPGPPTDPGRPDPGPPTDPGRPDTGPPTDPGRPDTGPPTDPGRPDTGPPTDRGRPDPGSPTDPGPPTDPGRPDTAPPTDPGRPDTAPPTPAGHGTAGRGGDAPIVDPGRPDGPRGAAAPGR